MECYACLVGEFGGGGGRAWSGGEGSEVGGDSEEGLMGGVRWAAGGEEAEDLSRQLMP